jgi:hypothetical protein
MAKNFSIRFLVLCAIALVPIVAYAQAGQQTQQTQPGGPEVDVAQGAVTIPVKDMPIVGPEHDLKPKHEVPLRTTHPGAPQTPAPDPVLQTSTGPLVSTTAGINIAGVGNGDYGFTPNAAPPDPNAAVGDTQVVQWVNESFAVFSKSTGALVAGPIAGNTLFAALGATHPCAVNNDGDPIAQYDKINNRWVLTQFSVTGGTPFFQCVAVSTTSDATGTFHVYAFSQPNFNDYPKTGIWPDAYYQTFNMFAGNTFAGARACALDGAAMRAGAAATQVCFQQSSGVASLLPSDVDGASAALGGPGSTSNGAAPPAGSPNFLLNFGANSLNLFRFHVDFVTPANSTFTGPINIPVAAFSEACSGGVCIPQPGTRQKLDSLGDRLMYRLAYRHFASDGHEALVVNHSITVGSGKRSSSVGVRWYELRSPNGTPTVFQQGRFAPNSTFRWMGSIAMDKVGDIAVGYSASSSSVFPSINFTGRVPTDPLGTLESESSIQAGLGSQLPTLNRWGDYSSISVDPVDDCTFWYTNQYQKANGTFNWSTRIASFKFPSCQ